MKYDAVIFDLFGTLVDNVRGNFAAFLRDHGVLAELAGDRGEELARLWGSEDAFRLRMTGAHPTGEDSIRYICGQMGIQPRPPVLRRVQELRMDYTRKALVPRLDAPEMLERIRGAGLKVGLMSVCSGEEARVWTEISLARLVDQALFSCEVGLMKPDPRFYQLICDRLSVRTDRCLYVGDGAGDELTGAEAVGMDAVLICAPHEEAIVMAREEARNWAGPQISTLTEVVDLVAEKEE